ncbi:hypothetical protein [Pseudolactococcus laudensis]|uniref:hypothetical protein n=1 Tax=Pseudolactococcus laudensis TaxID=1494461 RepID=UPI0002774E51|nr:hypothetical protein [Lactococcus laudensis]CCK18627.1 hypothetical protein BN193_00195 [Lactococcus raffinolactis 4877]
MIKKMKKNGLLLAIVITLFGLGAKSVVSAYQIATVANTRHEVWYVYGGSKTTYTYRQLTFRSNFSFYVSAPVRRDEGINPGYLYTYRYTVN